MQAILAGACLGAMAYFGYLGLQKNERAREIDSQRHPQRLSGRVPGYMQPEELTGNPRNQTTREDVIHPARSQETAGPFGVPRLLVDHDDSAFATPISYPSAWSIV